MQTNDEQAYHFFTGIAEDLKFPELSKRAKRVRQDDVVQGDLPAELDGPDRPLPEEQVHICTYVMMHNFSLALLGLSTHW